jgi:hypothetical protein
LFDAGLPRAAKLNGTRLAVVVAIVGWAPLALLASLQGLALGPTPRESLLLDFDAYAKFLLTLPLLAAAERMCPPRLNTVVEQFTASGIIAENERSRFQQVIQWARRILHSQLARIVIALIAFAMSILVGVKWQRASVSTWMAPSRDGGHAISLAGWWRMLVSQPLFLIVIFHWLWRLFVWGWLLRRISRFDLRLVASHPDLAGGLNFLTNSLHVFPILALAFGCIVAGSTANEVLYEGKQLTDYIFPVITLVVVVLAIFVSPLIAFSRPLFRLRERGTLLYGRLATAVGGEFEQKWLRAGTASRESLEAPDFSATIDLYSIVANIRSLRTMPMDWKSAAMLVIAALAPMIPVVLVAVPTDKVIQYVAKLLF